MRDHNPQPQAFSLIELLMVMAVIVVLIGLMLPALRSGRESARASVCGSNARQLAMANTVFARDHGQRYVLAAEDIFVGFGGRNRWHGVRNSPGFSADPQDNWFDPTRGPLRQYIDNGGQVKRCPSFEGHADLGGTAFEAGTGGYGYNQQYVGGRNDLFGFTPEAARTSATIEQVHRQAETIMFTDAALASAAGLIEYSFAEPPFFQLAPGEPSGSQPVPSIHFRHSRRVNVVWADGHVAPRRRTFTRGGEASTHAAADIGWFGPVANELFDLK